MHLLLIFSFGIHLPLIALHLPAHPEQLSLELAPEPVAVACKTKQGTVTATAQCF